jgi:hypothetical protein
MNKCFFSVLLLLLVIPVFGHSAPPKQVIGKSVGPNQVIIFEHNDFVTPCASYTLPSGSRHKLVPNLGNCNDVVSSILVGKNVKVLVFKHTNFKGHHYHFSTVDRLSKTLVHSAGVSKESVNDWISSIIIYPRSKKHPTGVYLHAGSSNKDRVFDTYRGQFFPLPELKTEDEVGFPDLTDYMNDKSDQLQLLGGVIVTVYEHNDFKGDRRTFPGAGPNPKTYYKLKTYQFSNKISSLRIQAVGDEAWQTPKRGESGSKPHRAPSAITPHKGEVITPQKSTDIKDLKKEKIMAPQTAKVAPSEPRYDLFEKIEMGTDRPGNDYRNFDLAKPEPDLCLEACQKDTRCKAFTYVEPGVQGPNARCWLKDAVPPAKLSPCCVSGVKR